MVCLINYARGFLLRIIITRQENISFKSLLAMVMTIEGVQSTNILPRVWNLTFKLKTQTVESLTIEPGNISQREHMRIPLRSVKTAKSSLRRLYLSLLDAYCKQLDFPRLAFFEESDKTQLHFLWIIPSLLPWLGFLYLDQDLQLGW